MTAVFLLPFDHSEVEFLGVGEGRFEPEFVEGVLFLVVVLGSEFVVFLFLEKTKMGTSFRLSSLAILPVRFAVFIRGHSVESNIVIYK